MTFRTRKTRVSLLCASVGLLMGIPARASAQVRSDAYVYAGPGGVSGSWAPAGAAIVAGGGGEWLVASGLGVGGEAGIFKTLGVVSLNGSWHVGQRSHETGLQPFVTSGYTHMEGEGGFSAWNAGGGVIVWGHHRGLRLEFRDHVRPDDRGTLHYWALRAGLTFG
jgi:hypothetical protein